MHDNPLLDRLRRRSSSIENHLIDEVRSGRLSRREFLRAASVVGIGLPLASAVVARSAAALPMSTAATRLRSLRIATATPGDHLDPLTIATDPGVLVVGQSGEYLTWSNDRLQLEPRLGTSWKPNTNATEWTFAIRKGVKFHNGRTLTADDVVATFDRLTDPASAGAAWGAFRGILTKGATRKVDAYTVTFGLDAAYGNFPYLVSSDNASAVILPRDYAGDWAKTFVGTGPWIRTDYKPGLGVTYKRNTAYWDRARIPRFDAMVVTFSADELSAIRLLQTGQVDGVASVSAATAPMLTGDPAVVLQSLRTSSHRQIHLRNDGVFGDRRVRQAFALALDRDAIVASVLGGKGDVGNDSPFAPAFASTDSTVAQRRNDLAKARQLMKDAGLEGGFDVQLDSWPGLEIPALVPKLQAAARLIDVTVRPNLSPDYYNNAWLDSSMGITDYRHRGAPNDVLWSTLRSDGIRNAARYRSPAYDALVNQYTAALDIASQRATASKIEALLIEDTPVVIPYFLNRMTAVRRGIAGVRATGAGHLDAAAAVSA